MHTTNALFPTLHALGQVLSERFAPVALLRLTFSTVALPYPRQLAVQVGQHLELLFLGIGK